MCLDSSALLKKYFQEIGSDEVQRNLENASSLGLSILTVPEVLSGLSRRRREGRLSEADYLEVNQRLIRDAAGAEKLHLTSDVLDTAIDLLEQGTIRTLDAMHIACALQWGAEKFLTADARQFESARRAGLNTVYI